MEDLDQVRARHRKELRDLQARITSKKKNATKKTRKGVNDECAELERQMRERQEAEVRLLRGEGEEVEEEEKEEASQPPSTVDGLADGLASASIASPPPPKRNRQKDRLARRAAEQEAARAAAEAEAASMTDRRGGERECMEAVFRARSLAEREIRPDGHCLFAAVADQLAERGIPVGGKDEEKEPYRAVRRAAAAYMEAHADDFAGFMEEPLPAYVAKMRDTAEWGGQLELAALASAYGVEIRVVRDGGVEDIRPAGGAADQTIWLAYYQHTYGLGEHYNSLRKSQE